MDDIQRSLLQILQYEYNSDEKNVNNYFSQIFYFTTENISSYYDKLNFQNKKILTVLSSGDHVLNAILKGCRDIDSFDIEPLTLYYYKLKEAAIKSLNYEKFCEFFIWKNYPQYNKNNNNSFDWKTYLKISPYLEQK